MIFISYRQLDEPFGVGLLYTVLRRRFSPSNEVFLDTMANRRKRKVQERLEQALGCTRLVVCAVGTKFEELQLQRQEAGGIDWVTWELALAAAAGLPVVPVVLRRPAPPTRDVPALLLARESSTVLQESAARDLEAVADRVAALLDGAVDPGANYDSDAPATRANALVRGAVDAMLRHVLPLGQHSMGNLDNVVDGVAPLLQGQEWLEHLAVGHMPGRPSGSALAVLTSHALRVAEFDETLKAHARRPLALPAIRSVALRPYRRLGLKRMADLNVTTAKEQLEIQGISREPAERLAELLQGPRR